MDAQTQGQEPASETKPGEEKGKRERSSIGFPYMTLVEAMEVADAIHKRVGNSSCGDDQLAPWLSVSPLSSGYRLRVSAAKMFGLIEGPSKGTHRLSKLGRQIVDRAQRDKAKAEAFLTVPLFGSVYDRFRGSALPPTAALESEFIGLGVAKKQVAKARSSFERSAKAAGFFNEGTDRLVKPGFAEDETPPDSGEAEKNDSPKGGGGDSGYGGGGSRHPLIEGLLQTLPPPHKEWSVDRRVAWLDAAAKCFALIYQGDGTITIKGQTDQTKAAEDAY